MTGTTTSTSTTEFFFGQDSCRGLPSGWPNNTLSTNFNPKDYKEINMTRIISLLENIASLEPYEAEDSE